MADKAGLKMFRFVFLVALLFQTSVCFANGEEFEEMCSCYDKCNTNFTSNSVLDVLKTGACKRGCRFYTIAYFSSHTAHGEANFAQKSCSSSCQESYQVEYEKSACLSGCLEAEKAPCIISDIKLPQISFSFLSETDILFGPELDPDYVHTDPGLRNQIGLSEESFADLKPKLPEIRFRDLPVKNGEGSVKAHVHTNFKCPKFYGLDSKLEFKNGKVIVGDLYLFAGVFLFVVLCFLIGHQMESRGLRKQQQKEAKTSKKAPKQKKGPLGLSPEKERLLKEMLDYDAEYFGKSDLFKTSGSLPKLSRSITLVFHEDPKIPVDGFLIDYTQDGSQDYGSEKVQKFETVLNFDDKDFDPNAPPKQNIR